MIWSIGQANSAARSINNSFLEVPKQMGANMYMMWYDDNGKKPVSLKIEEAVAAYVRHFKSHPNVVLVNEKEVEPVSGVLVRPANYVRLNNFWVGWEDQTA